MKTRTKQLEKINPKILAMAKAAGCQIWPRSEGNSHSFNGRTIAAFDHRGQPREPTNLIHDVTHYQVCPKKRRGAVEFGLGSSPDIGTAYADSLVDHDYAQMEEELASILGIMTERALGLNWQETWALHSWDMENDCTADQWLAEFLLGKRPNEKGHRRLKSLIRRGLLDSDLNPTILKEI